MGYAAIVDRKQTNDGEEFVDVRLIVTAKELDQAESEGLEIYTTSQEDGLTLEDQLFDGAEWVAKRPELPDLDKEITVPEVSYVDQRIELLQAEVEALADALLSVDPANRRALAVKNRSVDVKTALAFDKAADMEAIIAEVESAKSLIREA